MTEAKQEPQYYGRKTLGDGSHVPLSESEAAAIWADIEKRDAERVARLPDEQSAILAMCEAFERLRQLGWSEAIYCPKDGSAFEVLEAGSSGIHRCHYQGEWPDGSWWIEDGGDLWPSRPVLFRLYPEDEAMRKAKMAEAAARFRAERDAQ